VPSYKKVDVSEKQLEDLVRQYAGEIEEGLVYIDHQNWTSAGGRLDVFMVDSGRAFVVAELKVVEDDGMLLQALDYYDYVASHAEAFARLYKQHKPDPTQQVRLFLVAPSFSQTLVNRCKWIDVPISLFAYGCLELEGSEGILPVFSEQAIPSPPETVEVYQLSDHLKYITDATLRSLASSLMDEVKEWIPGRVVVDAIKYAVSFKVDGHVFAYFEPRRKHFMVSTYNSEGTWAAYPIHGSDDLDVVRPLMKAAMETRKH
jgi:hypothetical protein